MFFEKMRLKLLLEIFHEFFRKCMSNTSTPYSVIQNFSSKTTRRYLLGISQLSWIEFSSENIRFKKLKSALNLMDIRFSFSYTIRLPSQIHFLRLQKSK